MSTVSDLLIIGLAAGVGYVVLNKKGSLKESSGGSSQELASKPETTTTPESKLPMKASFNPTGMTAADFLKKIGNDEPTPADLAKAEQKLALYNFNKKLMGL